MCSKVYAKAVTTNEILIERTDEKSTHSHIFPFLGTTDGAQKFERSWVKVWRLKRIFFDVLNEDLSNYRFMLHGAKKAVKLPP
jgi:hypothetical protein